MRNFGSLCMLPLMLAAGMALATNLDRELNRQQLLELHERQRIAHLQKDATLLVSTIAEDFTSIEDGAVEKLGRDDLRRRFERYFAAVEFLEWSDICPPEIALSGDATMATVVVRKRVRLKSASAPASPVEATNFAWLEVWRKQGGRWLMTIIASTECSAATAACSGGTDREGR